MATANGIGFLIYFILECLLSFYWFKTFQIHKVFQTHKCSAIPFEIWNRCILIPIPLMAGLDNLRYFFGSLLSKEQCMSQSSQNLLHIVSFLHLVVLSYFIAGCYFFAVTPKVQETETYIDNTMCIDDTPKDLQKNTTNNTKSRIIWGFIWFLTFIFCMIGLYTFAVSRAHIKFETNFDIHSWHTDEEWLKETSAVVLIGYQIPVIVSTATLVMNIVIWCKYKYWIPFVFTLITAVCMGTFATSWKAGFFFGANFFEWTLFVQYFLVDRFLFYVEYKQGSNMANEV